MLRVMMMMMMIAIAEIPIDKVLFSTDRPVTYISLTK